MNLGQSLIRRRSTGLRRSTDGERSDLSGQLQTLVADPRYRHDKDFKSYVRRQFQRAYGSPTGTAHVEATDTVIGGAAGVEVFDRRHERALRNNLDEEGRLAGASRGAPPAVRSRRVSDSSASDPAVDVPELGRRALRLMDNSPVRDLSHIRTSTILRSVDAMIAAGEANGFHLATAHLRRYRDGIGGTVRLPWSLLRRARFVADAEQRVLQHYEDWLVGNLADTRLGQPFLALAEGRTLQLNAPGGDSNRQAPMWEATFGLQPLGSTIEQDLSLAIGEGRIQGFGDLAFTRIGNVIEVRGTIDLQLAETYNFEPGFVVGLVNAFLIDGPDVGNGGLMELEQRGVAKPFETVSSQRVSVHGEIVLDDSGAPDAARSDFIWRDVP